MANTYVAIAKTVLTTTQATITFSAIPSTYTDLLLTISARSDRASTVDTMKIRFNNAGVDTNLTSRRLQSSSGTSVASTSDAYASAGNIPAASQSANIFGNTNVYFPNYLVNAYKPMSVSVANESASATDGNEQIIAGLWSDTTAINRIDLVLITGPNFISGSRFDLYGIKSS